MFGFIKKLFKPAKEKPKETPKEIINIDFTDKSKPKSKPKMGRPKKEFDTEQFEKLCELQCTQQEIANWFKMTIETVKEKCKENYDGKTFLEISNIYRDNGKSSLRRKQFILAEKFPHMAIWLGKQYLHQKDDPIIDQSVHYHYTQVNDTELIRQAKERGIPLPKELQRQVDSN